jgi:hypothetical protein
VTAIGCGAVAPNPNDTPMVPVKGQTGPAWVAVIALAIILALFVIVSAFSQHNARTSVDGHQAVYSHNLP